MSVPSERCYWVEPGQLLAGCYPGSKRFDEAGKRLNALLDAGIRTIINLMEEDETDWQGDEFEHYEETVRILADNRGVDVDCLRIPIRDVDVPSSIVMPSILDKIDQAIARGKRSMCIAGEEKAGQGPSWAAGSQGKAGPPAMRRWPL